MDPLAAVSPSGDLLAYTAEGSGGVSQVYVRALDQLRPCRWPAPRTVAARCSLRTAGTPFLQQGHLKRIPSTAEPPPPSPATPRPRRSGGKRRVRDDDRIGRAGSAEERRHGAVHRPAHSTKGEGISMSCRFSRAGYPAIGTTAMPREPSSSSHPRTGGRVLLPLGVIAWAAYSDGHLVWCQAGGVVYAPLRPGEGPHHRPGAVPRHHRAADSGSRPKIAQAGRTALAYVPAQPLTLVTVSRDGRVTPLLDSRAPITVPGSRPTAAAWPWTSRRRRATWVLDLTDHTLSRATFQNSGHDPTWLPAAKAAIYAEIRGAHTGIVRAPVDGSRPPTRCTSRGYRSPCTP